MMQPKTAKPTVVIQRFTLDSNVENVILKIHMYPLVASHNANCKHILSALRQNNKLLRFLVNTLHMSLLTYCLSLVGKKKQNRWPSQRRMNLTVRVKTMFA